MSDEDKEKKEAKGEPEKKDDKDWDKIRQEADQYKANFEKLAAERDALEEQAGEKEAQLEQSKTELAKLQAKLEGQAQKDDLDIENFDPNDYEGLAKRFPKLAKIVTDMQKKQKQYDETVAEYRAEKQEADKRKRRDAIIGKIRGLVEDEFTVKRWNAIKKQADELVDSGEEPQYTDPLDAYALLRKVGLKQVQKEEAEKAKKKSTPTDTGVASIPFQEAEGVKTGTTAEVLADMKKNPSSWQTK